jgi:RNA-binding protein
MDLSRAQIKRLRAEGHRLKLKPVVTIGQKGLSDNLQHEIDTALAHHELLKLRIPALDKPARRELAERICGTHNATLVEAIGGVIVIYRRNAKSDRFAAIVDS